ncbi:MAG: hypothetical protein JXR23_00085 [Pontiellaceae bacterium]|nr:hypothetical protein [Pontiellaceae bacterium]
MAKARTEKSTSNANLSFEAKLWLAAAKLRNSAREENRLRAGQLSLAKEPGDVLLKKKVWYRPVEPNVEQASRLLNVPQASRLPASSEKKQAGRSFHDPDTAKRSDRECHRMTVQRPASWRGVPMPAGLRDAHHQLDLAVDRISRSKPFASDEERLDRLFKLYEEMALTERLF